MKRLYRILLLLTLVIAFGCGNKNDCEDIACFTPPELFTFQIIDISSGENLFTNGTFDASEIEVVNTLNNESYEFSFIDENSIDLLAIYSVGWKTEIVNLEVSVGGEHLLTFYVDAERKNGDCCSFTDYKETRIDDAEFEYDSSTGIYSILVQP
ncbi:hypothetical protein [Mangrovibacterium lignilyticum]|uniref:hypothetical protein n=1 Tax=Mangrovibacterium lignilyticum TaxID=2668052 RepID=UPI0013D26A76|nr:hypothetical protein [Mangrovibacterium lignilyticum]